jgi:hypothetical protein
VFWGAVEVGVDAFGDAPAVSGAFPFPGVGGYACDPEANSPEYLPAKGVWSPGRIRLPLRSTRDPGIGVVHEVNVRGADATSQRAYQELTRARRRVSGFADFEPAVSQHCSTHGPSSPSNYG